MKMDRPSLAASATTATRAKTAAGPGAIDAGLAAALRRAFEAPRDARHEQFEELLRRLS